MGNMGGKKVITQNNNTKHTVLKRKQDLNDNIGIPTQKYLVPCTYFCKIIAYGEAYIMLPSLKNLTLKIIQTMERQSMYRGSDKSKSLILPKKKKNPQNRQHAKCLSNMLHVFFSPNCHKRDLIFKLTSMVQVERYSEQFPSI